MYGPGRTHPTTKQLREQVHTDSDRYADMIYGGSTY